MASLPKLNLQRTPTVDGSGMPTCCFVCGMRAWGIGINQNRKDPDPHYICKRCAVAIDDYKKIDCMDQFELKALDGGVDAVGEYLRSEPQVGTDLAYFDDLSQKMLVKAAVEGFARELRRLINEDAPF